MRTPLTPDEPPAIPTRCAICGLRGRFLWRLVRHEQEQGEPFWAHRSCFAQAMAAGQTLAMDEDQRTPVEHLAELVSALDETRWLEYLPEHCDPVACAAALAGVKRLLAALRGAERGRRER